MTERRSDAEQPTPIKHKHAKLLDALDDMQRSFAYALHRNVLAEAEAVIVDYECVERLQQKRIEACRAEVLRLAKRLRQCDPKFQVPMHTNQKA